MLLERERADILQVAHKMADHARSAILPYFRSTDLAVANKAASTGYDPVSVADKAAEAAMREILAKERPHDSVLGEEFGHQIGGSTLTWVIDPIDGTRAFIAGASSWGVLISVEVEGRPILGILDQPFTGERWVGGLGQATHQDRFGSRQLAVRRRSDLNKAVLMTTFPEVGSDAEGAAFRRVARHVQLTRYGLDCYAYGLLALGQIDLVIEAGLQRYDISAPRAIVEAAGGVVTNWQGGPADEGGQVIAAATHALHQSAVALLQGG